MITNDIILRCNWRDWGKLYKSCPQILWT